MLLGVSAYDRPHRVSGPSDAQVDRAREAQGGQLQPIPFSQQRWYLKDLEAATAAADGGDLALAARLMRAARTDGVLSGVLSTRTAGLVRLPKRFRGDPELVEQLELGHDKVRSVFDEMFPPTELALLAADGELLGVGVGELVPVQGRDYPVLVRLDPEFLVYRWTENQWYFRSIVGLIPITPGDGRWVLHTPGGRSAPWQHGLWRAVGRAFIRKEHAALHKDNWEAKLANPARIAIAPQGGTEAQKQSWFRKVMAWGVNTVFGMTPGYDVKLLESNGRGAESFDKTIARQDEEIVIAVAGQTVTTDGGAGFQNSDVHKSIRADLIKATADALAYTINTQGLPVFVVVRAGLDALDSCPAMEWDVTPPKDRQAEATALMQVGNAIEKLTEALAVHDVSLDVGELLNRFGIPVAANATTVTTAIDELAKAIELARASGLQPTEASVRTLLGRAGLELEEIPKGTSEPKALDLAPTDVAKVVLAREARASKGLAPFGDDRDGKTVHELGAEDAADAEADAEVEAAQEAA